MEAINVMITAAGNVFMPGTIACLKKNGEREIRVIGADMSDDATILQMCDVAYPVPRGNDPSYADALLEICRKEKVRVILPIMSVELGVLAGNRARFEAIGTKIAVSDPGPLAIANHKRRLFDYMKETGIRCADYYEVHSREELIQATEALGYPARRVCIKATEGSGSRGFRILDEALSGFDAFMHEKPSSSLMKRDDFLKMIREADDFPELMVMEYLPGTEYSVDLLADHGKTLYSCCRKSLRMENSIMLEVVIVDEPSVTGLCEEVVRELKLDGNIGFDLKAREDGTPMIMECNPRITAGIPFFAEAGVNLPYLCVKKLLGEALPAVKPVYGKIIRRRWMEMSV